VYESRRFLLTQDIGKRDDIEDLYVTTCLDPRKEKTDGKIIR